MYKKHKYRAQKVEIDNISFHSKKEAKRYQELKAMKEAGEVDFFLRQVPLHLPGCRYVIDFLVFYSDETVSFEEVRGFQTPMQKLKVKQAEELYGVKINIM